MKYFVNKLGRLEHGVGYRVKGNNTIFFVANEKKNEQLGERTSTTAKLFVITDLKRTDLIGQEFWQGASSLVSQETSEQEQQIQQQKN